MLSVGVLYESRKFSLHARAQGWNPEDKRTGPRPQIAKMKEPSPRYKDRKTKEPSPRSQIGKTKEPSSRSARPRRSANRKTKEPYQGTKTGRREKRPKGLKSGRRKNRPRVCALACVPGHAGRVNLAAGVADGVTDQNPEKGVVEGVFQWIG